MSASTDTQASRESGLKNHIEKAGNATATLLFANSTIFDNEPAVHFRIKVHCAGEDEAFRHTLERRGELASVINGVIQAKLGTDAGLKDLTITRGSIDFEGFAGYFSFKTILDDLLSIFKDVAKALANYYRHFTEGEPITKETEDTTIAVGGSAALAVAAFTLGGPAGLVVAAGVVGYRFIKSLL